VPIHVQLLSGKLLWNIGNTFQHWIEISKEGRSNAQRMQRIWDMGRRIFWPNTLNEPHQNENRSKINLDVVTTSKSSVQSPPGVVWRDHHCTVTLLVAWMIVCTMEYLRLLDQTHSSLLSHLSNCVCYSCSCSSVVVVACLFAFSNIDWLIDGCRLTAYEWDDTVCNFINITWYVQSD